MYFCDLSASLTPAARVSELECDTSDQNIYIVPLISRPGMLEKMINLTLSSQFSCRPPFIHWGPARPQHRPGLMRCRDWSHISLESWWGRASEDHHKYSLISLFRLPACQPALLWNVRSSDFTARQAGWQCRVKYKNTPSSSWQTTTPQSLCFSHRERLHILSPKPSAV